MNESEIKKLNLFCINEYQFSVNSQIKTFNYINYG